MEPRMLFPSIDIGWHIVALERGADRMALSIIASELHLKLFAKRAGRIVILTMHAVTTLGLLDCPRLAERGRERVEIIIGAESKDFVWYGEHALEKETGPGISG